MERMERTIGRYKIIKEIGQGAMGKVYLAKDPVIDRLLAIKIIRVLNLVDSEDQREHVERFYREVKAAGKLSHPNIVAIYDAGFDEEKGLHYMVMEYVEGKDLKSYLKEGKKFTEEEVVRIGLQIASALDYAHRQNIIHRDIKPANIIINKEGVAKLMDLGIAKFPAQEELTAAGQFVGTPAYVSPEQIQHKPLDGRSDIFSLGIVLYELFSGEKPFQGADFTQMTLAIATQPHKPLEGASPGFTRIIDRCLAKEPNLRFPTAGALAEELNNLLEGTQAIQSKQTEDKEATLIGPKEEKKGFYKRFKEKVLAHPRFFFLALPIQLHWSLLLIFGVLLLGLTPIAFTWHKARKANLVYSPVIYYPQAHTWRQMLTEAQELAKEGKEEEALATLQLILFNLPTSPYPRKLYHSLKEQEKDEAKALEKAKTIEALLAKGTRYYTRGLYKEAREAFKKALDLEDDLPEAKEYLAKIYVKEQMLKQKYARPITAPTKESAPSPSKKTIPLDREVTVTFTFPAPIGKGYMMIIADGRQILREEFNFTKTQGWLKKKRIFLGGTLERSFLFKPGKHTLRIWVVGKEEDSHVNAYKHFPLFLEPQFDYRITLNLKPEINTLATKIKEVPYAP